MEKKEAEFRKRAAKVSKQQDKKVLL